MSIDFFQRLTMSEGTYVHQMSCTREDFSTKISLKMLFWKDLKGVLKKSFILKDPVVDISCFRLFRSIQRNTRKPVKRGWAPIPPPNTYLPYVEPKAPVCSFF